jgi:DnaJ-class molecular chaperone
MAGGFGGDPRGGFDGAGGFDMNDLLSQLFGAGGAPGFGGGFDRGFGGQQATPGVRAELSLDLRTACLGGVRQLTTSGGSMSVRIPPGVRDGETLRLRGQGARVGGPPGSDLHLTLRVAAHPVFRREGEDLHVDLPVTVAEAIAGGTVRVPTLQGAVELTVPPHTPNGRTLRVRGKGVARRKQAPGDLYVHVQVQLPESLDPDALAAIERAYRGDVRSDLLRAAAA